MVVAEPHLVESRVRVAVVPVEEQVPVGSIATGCEGAGQEPGVSERVVGHPMLH